MRTYIINVDGKETTKIENGEHTNERYAIQFKDSKTIETSNLTRKDILKAVKSMLCLCNEYSENDLFDGNEEYFILSVLENSDGYEKIEGDQTENNTLYNAEYFIDIEIVEKLKAVDIK